MTTSKTSDDAATAGAVYKLPEGTALPDLESAYRRAATLVPNARFAVVVDESEPAKPRRDYSHRRWAVDLQRVTASDRATREVEADPIELAELREARARLDRGEGHWVPDDMSVEDDLLTD